MGDYKQKDYELWQQYKRDGSRDTKHQLLNQFNPLIESQVNKWSGVVPKEVLRNKAKIYASKALDSYDDKKGAALSTHITNNLAPLSRTVYKHQNTARLPENVSLQFQSYNAANEHLKSSLGREPTTDELQDELGWGSSDINRIQQYDRRDLVESVGVNSNDFFSTKEDEDEDLLAAIYYDLAPQDKILFEHTTGFNNKPKLSNEELRKKLGISQPQLSYKKTLLTKKIQNAL